MDWAAGARGHPRHRLPAVPGSILLLLNIPSVAMTNHFLILLLPDHTQGHKRLLVGIKRSVASLLTKAWQEFSGTMIT